jgi:hypothetical protein
LTFARLRVADWVVFIAALALLFTTAADWYSTKSGEEARRIQEQARPEEGQPSGQIQTEVEQGAGALAEGQERNAWQEDGTIDRIILICLLVTTALGVAAAFWRASGRESDGLGPYALVGFSATVTAFLVLYRIIQEPGFDELTVVQIGAPLALGVLGVIAFAAATSLRQEERRDPVEPARAA